MAAYLYVFVLSVFGSILQPEFAARTGHARLRNAYASAGEWLSRMTSLVIRVCLGARCSVRIERDRAPAFASRAALFRMRADVLMPSYFDATRSPTLGQRTTKWARVTGDSVTECRRDLNTEVFLVSAH